MYQQNGAFTFVWVWGVYDPNDEEEQYETLNLSNFKGKIISVKLGENFEIDRSSFFK